MIAWEGLPAARAQGQSTVTMQASTGRGQTPERAPELVLERAPEPALVLAQGPAAVELEPVAPVLEQEPGLEAALAAPVALAAGGNSASI
jgi:hypothetical protein